MKTIWTLLIIFWVCYLLVFTALSVLLEPILYVLIGIAIYKLIKHFSGS